MTLMKSDGDSPTLFVKVPAEDSVDQEIKREPGDMNVSDSEDTGSDPEYVCTPNSSSCEDEAFDPPHTRKKRKKRSSSRLKSF